MAFKQNSNGFFSRRADKRKSPGKVFRETPGAVRAEQEVALQGTCVELHLVCSD
jgi:hypothetical protein